MRARALSRENIFVIPMLDRFLLYAPLHNFASLLNLASLSLLKRALISAENTGYDQLDEILGHLQVEVSPPQPKTGAFVPMFVGLLPTRACNLICKYCAFQSQGPADQIMDPRLACRVIDWYINLVQRAGGDRLEIHYFGGEPFCVEELIDVTLHYTKIRAGQLGYNAYFEAATNGTLSERRCRWAADHFDTIVLSLDGPPEIHDDHRRRKDGRGVSDIIARNAKILAEGPVKFCIRACITAATVERMAEFAAWFCQMFRPEVVCFEPLQPTPQSVTSNLSPPDPWRFAANFICAAQVLEGYGVEALYAAADIQDQRVSFCPLGSDAAIVSPNGIINACYLLESDWRTRGLDMRLGACSSAGSVVLDQEAVESMRQLNVLNKPFCAACFCKWHCAGGCHVNNHLPSPANPYNRLCIQTRLITLYHILKTMGQAHLMASLLNSPAVLEHLMQPSGDQLFGEKDEQFLGQHNYEFRPYP